jgi:hypothetical protein
MATKAKLAGNVLDTLMGLTLDTPGAGEKIAKAVEKRFTELQGTQIYIAFIKDSDWWDSGGDNGDEHERYSLVVEPADANRVSGLYTKLAALRTLGFGIVDGHAS